MPSLPELTKGLKTAFEGKQYETCLKLLLPIKIELIKAKLLIPDIKSAKENQSYLQDLNIAKKILEIGALSSIYCEDFETFMNYYSQLSAFYFSDVKELSDSDSKFKLISLYLLILLAQNDYTKLHSEFEFLSRYVTNLEESSYLSYPVKLERLLMEGSYQKAWDLLQTGSKVEEFNVFTKTLKDAIREEIALNSEQAYSSLPLFNAKTLLFFENEKEMEAFAKERDWSVNHGVITFGNDSTPDRIESGDTVDMAIDYAVHLESIV